MAGTVGHSIALAGTSAGTIGNITSVKVSGVECEAVDISNAASTSKWREFLPGMLNAGEITFEITYDGAGTGVSTLYTKLGVSDTWTITFPGTGGSTDACSGFISKIDIDAPYDGQITASVTIKRTGAVTFTA